MRPRDLLIFIAYIIIACSLIGFLSAPVHAAGTSGLNFETYIGGGAQPSVTNRTLISTGTVPYLNHNWGSGAVLNSGRSDGVIVHFTGYLQVPATATYTFGMAGDDGVWLKINNTQVINSWIESGGALRSGNIALTAGTVVPVEMWYYENGGGALVTFQWIVNGAWQIVPTASLATDSTYWAPPAPVYSSGITQIQQTRKTANQAANAGGHAAYVEIVGSDNLVSVEQIGGNGHYVSVSVNGSVNSVDVLQSTSGTDRHYMEASVVGSNNNLVLKQQGSSKTAFVAVDGNYNTVSTDQKGTGNHYLDLKVTGNNHTAGIIQDGAGSHKATVELSGTQPWNFTLNQNGSTDKTYSLPYTQGGVPISGACYTVGGCSLTVNQQ